MEYRFEAAAAGPFVTEFCAKMITAFERAAADFEADVFGLEVFVGRWCVQCAMLASRCLPFTGSFLSWTTALAAFVPSTIEG
jgi:hypothetical protein